MFEAPIFAFGAADDDIFERFKSPEIIGGIFMAPAEWMPGAKTVISFFLPYTDRIKSSNAKNDGRPSDEWLHGRYEGQKFVQALALHIYGELTSAGHKSLIPANDERCKTGDGPNGFASSWSERHVAFACGLGTFGLSRGLITESGVCGRFGSILTELDLPRDQRPYGGVYEYCIMCGACARRCPAGAITKENGKDNNACSDFLDKTIEMFNPRYGCGKCQTKTPCESRAPKPRARG